MPTTEPHEQHQLLLTIPLLTEHPPVSRERMILFAETLDGVLSDCKRGRAWSEGSPAQAMVISLQFDSAFQGGVAMVRELLWWAGAPAATRLSHGANEEIPLALSDPPAVPGEQILHLRQVRAAASESAGEDNPTVMPLSAVAQKVLRMLLTQAGATGPDADGAWQVVLPDGGALQICQDQDGAAQHRGVTVIVRQLSAAGAQLIYHLMARCELAALPAGLVATHDAREALRRLGGGQQLIESAADLLATLERGTYGWWRTVRRDQIIDANRRQLHAFIDLLPRSPETTLDAEGRVIALNLNGRGLTHLPPEVGQFDALREIHLGIWVVDNGLMFEADIQYNRLTGLPLALARLTQLEVLVAGHNTFGGVPAVVPHLTTLRHLDLRNNRIATLPPEIGQLTALEELVLENNRLTTLPDTFGELTALRELDLGNNPLKTLPPSFARLRSLEALQLSSTRLDCFPDVLLELPSLKTLRLWNTPIRAIPPEIARLATLEGLWLGTVQRAGLPPELLALPRLKELYVNGRSIALPKNAP